MVDLRDRLLKEGGLILPHRLRLFVVPVQAEEGPYAPFAWEQTLHGLTFRALRPYADGHPESYLYRVYKPLPLDAFLAEASLGFSDSWILYPLRGLSSTPVPSHPPPGSHRRAGGRARGTGCRASQA